MNNISKTTRKQHVLIKIASTGIGYATAIYLNKIGFKVFAGVRNERLSKEYQFDFSLLYKEDNIVFSPISFENQLFDNKLI